MSFPSIQCLIKKEFVELGSTKFSFDFSFFQYSIFRPKTPDAWKFAHSDVIGSLGVFSYGIFENQLNVNVSIIF